MKIYHEVTSVNVLIQKFLINYFEFSKLGLRQLILDFIKKSSTNGLLVVMYIIIPFISFSQKAGYNLIISNYRDGKVTAQRKVKLPPKFKTIYINKTRILRKTKIVEVPIIEYKYVNVYSPVIPIDTEAILKAVSNKYVLKDEIKLPDGIGKITITDTLYKNRLLSRIWTSELIPKIIKEEIVKSPPIVKEFYLGPEITSNLQSFNNWYSINVLLKNRKNNIVKLGGGINMRDGNLGPQPFISSGVYFKIK